MRQFHVIVNGHIVIVVTQLSKERNRCHELQGIAQNEETTKAQALHGLAEFTP